MAAVVGRGVRAGVTAYARLQLPRSVGLTEAAAAAFKDAWPREGVRETTGLWHGYRLRLDCADYFQRLTWILRRYPDVPTQRLLWRVLRPGDTFIDGGANIGLIALLAAWRIGRTGLIHAFEPNPDVCEALRWHIEANSLTDRVQIHALGLGDVESEGDLQVPGLDNLGAGTLADVPARHGVVRTRCRVRIAPADALALNISGRLVVKLDIEGFEVRALRGMTQLIETHRPLILTEVNPEMLAHAGTSPAALAEMLRAWGYSPYAYDARWRPLGGWGLRLTRADPADLPVDVAWIHPHGVGSELSASDTH